MCLHVLGPMNELPIVHFFLLGCPYNRFLYIAEINIHVIVWIFLRHPVVSVFTFTFLIFH